MATSTTSSLLLIAAFISQAFLLPVSSSFFHDQKNFPIYFPPVYPGSPPVTLTPPVDPGTPPVSLTPPIVRSPPTGSYSYPPPTHVSGSPPPVHHAPPHGGGGGHHHGGSPPTNCVNPTPPKHVDPSPPHHHNPSPSPPTGGYHYNPPPTTGGTPPTVPSLSPPVLLPPTTPGSPPFDPNSPPPPIGGTCDYWRNHPNVIWGLFGWWGTTIGSAFGIATQPATGTHLSLLQALSNTRTDGIGALYREGTASLLNSMVNKNFPYSTNHVKDSFVAALGSNKAAAAQARVFKLANEGHMKLRV